MASKVLLVSEEYSEMTHLETNLRKIGFNVVGISNELNLQEQMLGFNPEIVIAFGKVGKVSPIRVGKRLKEMPRSQCKVILSFDPSGVSAADLAHARVDQILEYPTTIEKILVAIAKILGQDPEFFVTKLGRLKMTQTPMTPASGTVGQNGPAGSPRPSAAMAGVAVTGPAVANESEHRFIQGGSSEVRDAVESGDSIVIPFQRNFNDGARPSAMAAEPPENSARRGERFKEALGQMQVNTKATFSHLEVRNKQTEMKEAWDQNLMKELDREKRQFVDALFNKK